MSDLGLDNGPDIGADARSAGQSNGGASAGLGAIAVYRYLNTPIIAFARNDQDKLRCKVVGAILISAGTFQLLRNGAVVTPGSVGGNVDYTAPEPIADFTPGFDGSRPNVIADCLLDARGLPAGLYQFAIALTVTDYLGNASALSLTGSLLIM